MFPLLSARGSGKRAESIGVDHIQVVQTQEAGVAAVAVPVEAVEVGKQKKVDCGVW